MRADLWNHAQLASDYFAKRSHKQPASLWWAFWYGVRCAHWGPHTIQGSPAPEAEDYHYRATLLGYAFGISSLHKVGDAAAQGPRHATLYRFHTTQGWGEI